MTEKQASSGQKAQPIYVKAVGKGVEVINPNTSFYEVSPGERNCAHSLARVIPKLYQCTKCGLMISWR